MPSQSQYPHKRSREVRPRRLNYVSRVLMDIRWIAAIGERNEVEIRWGRSHVVKIALRETAGLYGFESDHLLNTWSLPNLYAASTTLTMTLKYLARLLAAEEVLIGGPRRTRSVIVMRYSKYFGIGHTLSGPLVSCRCPIGYHGSRCVLCAQLINVYISGQSPQYWLLRRRCSHGDAVFESYDACLYIGASSASFSALHLQ